MLRAFAGTSAAHGFDNPLVRWGLLNNLAFQKVMTRVDRGARARLPHIHCALTVPGSAAALALLAALAARAWNAEVLALAVVADFLDLFHLTHQPADLRHVLLTPAVRAAVVGKCCGAGERGGSDDGK